MPPILDLVQEFLRVEKEVAIPEQERTQKLVELVERIKELRPLQDPMLIIERYRS